MAQEHSEIDIATNDTIQVRSEVEGLVTDILALHIPIPDKVNERLLTLLNLARVNEARMTGVAQSRRIIERFEKRMTVGRNELREMQEWEQLHAETLRAAEQRVSDVQLVNLKRALAQPHTTRRSR
jgi:hypothetical protein